MPSTRSSLRAGDNDHERRKPRLVNSRCCSTDVHETIKWSSEACPKPECRAVVEKVLEDYKSEQRHVWIEIHHVVTCYHQQPLETKVASKMKGHLQVHYSELPDTSPPRVTRATARRLKTVHEAERPRSNNSERLTSHCHSLRRSSGHFTNRKR
jgi:hypothetical protein